MLCTRYLHVHVHVSYDVCHVEYGSDVHVHAHSKVQVVSRGAPLISSYACIVAQYMDMHVCTSCEVLHRLGGAGSGSPQCAVIGCQHSHALSKCVPHSLLSFMQ